MSRPTFYEMVEFRQCQDVKDGAAIAVDILTKKFILHFCRNSDFGSILLIFVVHICCNQIFIRSVRLVHNIRFPAITGKRDNRIELLSVPLPMLRTLNTIQPLERRSRMPSINNWLAKYRQMPLQSGQCESL